LNFDDDDDDDLEDDDDEDDDDSAGLFTLKLYLNRIYIWLMSMLCVLYKDIYSLYGLYMVYIYVMCVI
jgi:hypothetical protein